MKKILTICVFAFALLISSQGFAQLAPVSNAKTNIKENVMKLSSALGLDKAQTKALAKAYIAREEAFKTEKGNISNEFKNKAQEKFLTSLKGVLTEDQISKIKSMDN